MKFHNEIPLCEYFGYHFYKNLDLFFVIIFTNKVKGEE